MWRREGDPSGRFLNVFMDQNNMCNLKCRMCGFSDARVQGLPRYHMPRELFDSIADQLFPHTAYLQLSILTEPFMTPDFPDRLQRVRELGVPYSHVITNGTLLSESVIGKVLDAGISRLTFSIDGGTREGYEEIRVGAKFQNVIRNVRLFKRMRDARGSAIPQLRINHVLTKWNIDRFDEFLALIEDIRPEAVDVRTVEPMTFTSGEESADPLFFERVRKVRAKFRDFCKQTGIEDSGFIRDRETPIDLLTDAGRPVNCRRPWDTLAIHANGDVQPCMSWTRPPYGNLSQQSFEEIWRGSKLEALRREFDNTAPGVDCQHCSIKKRDSAEPYDDFFFKMISKSLPPRVF